MKIETLKLYVRYIIIAFVLYLTWKITSIEYINALKEGREGVLQVTTGSVFGALTLILNWHFTQSIDKE